MITNKNIVGAMGEELASLFLKHKGYKVLARNYSCKYGEIDIIAFIDETIVFVEVKTRRSDDFIYACESVNLYKQKKLRITANKFLSDKNLYAYDYRFDVVECYWQDKKINHIVDAF